MGSRQQITDGNETRGGSLVLLLHAHLPYCRKPKHPVSLEENWFFEALTECYLQLVRVLDRLERDGITPCLTLSLSPTLICLLGDQSLLDQYRRRLALAEKIAERDAQSGEFQEAAARQARFFAETRHTWEERCGGDPLGVFREYAETGRIELATTAATHAFLPAYQARPHIVESQIRVGIDCFEKTFEHRPGFFWLPECGYFPGIETMLEAAGVRAFGLESHAITRARPAPERGVRSPLRCPNGLVGFGRDEAISRLVWSAAEGYPGHPDYREFHRDRIHELPESILGEWLRETGVRLPAGLKYWRVTGPEQEKALYDARAAAARAREHAEHFLEVVRRADRDDGGNPDDGIRFAPFDAELFGHWWFEGPLWLEELFRALSRQNELVPVTATEAVAGCHRPAEGCPAPSSWGDRGDNSHWINRETDWIYPILFEADHRLRKLLQRHGGAPGNSPEGRALRQACRTFLLAQASDWPFMIRAGTAADLAVRHMEGLLGRLRRLLADLEDGRIDRKFLSECEATDRAFPELKVDHFTPARHAGSGSPEKSASIQPRRQTL